VSEHEVRLALVLNGGVSLAVWMGGVAHELDLARRASAGPNAPPPKQYDEALSARWAELCDRDMQHRRVVVDVIAGTSAGGLNGALLATAIANGSTLDPPDDQPGPWLRGRWSELGALTSGKLLPDPAKQPDSDEGPFAQWVFDGEFFSKELAKAMDVVGKAGDPAAAEGVTLFVTASGLGTQQYTVQDGVGQPFDVVDHRYLFEFSSEDRLTYASDGSYTSSRDDGFSHTALLTQASRSSASFPGAFEPVEETEELAERPPRVLPRWAHPTGWLVDGGVLDNAPFGPVLDTITRRPVAGRASRYVVYVVPSAGTDLTAAVEADDKPTFRNVVLSAVKYPGEIDFRGNIEQLEQLLREADASWSDTQRLFDRCVVDEAERKRVMEAARLLQPAYCEGRAAGGVWESVNLSRSGRTTVLEANAALSDDDVKKILASDPAWVPSNHGVVEATVPGPDGEPLWPWGTDPAERVVRLVLRSQRTRLERARTAPTAADADELEEAVRATSDTLERVVAVRDALTAAVQAADLDLDDDPAAATKVTADINGIFEALNVRPALGTLLTDLQEHIPSRDIETALAVEIVSRCTAARAPLQRSAPFQFLRVGPDVNLPLLADDEQAKALADRLGDRILYGTQVAHFGAFGAIEWRQWDWLMGRLHGAAHLGNMLGADESWIRETQELILEAEDWSYADFVNRIRQLDRDFPAEPGRQALATMHRDLNATEEGRQTIQGLLDRLVDVSPGLPASGADWVRAVAAREGEPTGRLLRWVRWLTAPARQVLWQGLVHGVKQDAMRRPLLAGWMPGVLGFAVFAVLALFAGLYRGQTWSLPLAGLAGAVAVTAGGLLYLRRRLERLRRSQERLAEKAIYNYLRPSP
jgi:predicted acylesterase/phospholipase RssA